MVFGTLTCFNATMKNLGYLDTPTSFCAIGFCSGNSYVKINFYSVYIIFINQYASRTVFDSMGSYVCMFLSQYGISFLNSLNNLNQGFFGEFF